MAAKPLPSLSIRAIPRELFDAVRLGAALQGQSMETFARAALQAHVVRLAKGPKGAPLAALLDAAGPRKLLAALALVVPLVLLSLGCARVTVQMQPGQTDEIVQRAHTVCHEEAHSYLAQTTAALFGPVFYLERARQNRAYVACMIARGFAVSYQDGMGWLPDLALQPAR